LGRKGLPKTNTALLYVNGDVNPHVKWGEQALIYEPSKRAREQEVHYIIERFKLYLDEDAKGINLPVLPRNLDVKKFIADYLSKMKNVCKIKKFFTRHTILIDYLSNYCLKTLKGN